MVLSCEPTVFARTRDAGSAMCACPTNRQLQRELFSGICGTYRCILRLRVFKFFTQWVEGSRGNASLCCLRPRVPRKARHEGIGNVPRFQTLMRGGPGSARLGRVEKWRQKRRRVVDTNILQISTPDVAGPSPSSRSIDSPIYRLRPNRSPRRTLFVKHCGEICV